MQDKSNDIRGTEPIRLKIVIGNRAFEQISQFNYLGSEIGFVNDRDILHNIDKFKSIYDTV